MSAREQPRRDTRAGAEEAPARGPGRPRSAAADAAIVRATMELLAEQGMRGLSIEAVAARAGVGKTTIYRRFDSKEELVAEAIGHLPPPGAPPDTGSLLGDLKALVAHQQQRMAGAGIPRAIPMLLSEVNSDPELRRLILERGIEPLRAVLAEMVARAVDRGEVRRDVDVETVIDILHGIPVYRLLLTGGDLSEVQEVPDRLIPLLLDGIAPGARGPEPG